MSEARQLLKSCHKSYLLENNTKIDSKDCQDSGRYRQFSGPLSTFQLMCLVDVQVARRQADLVPDIVDEDIQGEVPKSLCRESPPIQPTIYAHSFGPAARCANL